MKLKFTIHKDKADVAEDARTISFPGDDEASIPEPQSSPGAPYPVESSEKQSPGIMAPVAHSDQKVVEDQIKDVIQDLYQIMVQVNSYDQANRPSKEVLEHSVKQLDTSLQKVYATASAPTSNLPLIPPELITYVDNGRNPDIYTREFVEGARRSNQLMKGKMEAFGSFRDVLAQEMAKACPELREDIGRVLDATGGRRGVKLDGEEAT